MKNRKRKNIFLSKMKGPKILQRKKKLLKKKHSKMCKVYKTREENELFLSLKKKNHYLTIFIGLYYTHTHTHIFTNHHFEFRFYCHFIEICRKKREMQKKNQILFPFSNVKIF